MEESDKYALALFFKNSPYKQKVSDSVKAIEGLSHSPMIADPISNIGVEVNIADRIDRNNFVLNFGEYFFGQILPKIQEEITGPKGKTTPNKAVINLLENLELKLWGDIKYLVFKGAAKNYSPDEIMEFQEGFKMLPENVKTLITAYQIAKDGFKYSTGTFDKIIDTKELIKRIKK